MTICGECGEETDNIYCCDQCWQNLTKEEKDAYVRGHDIGTCSECKTKNVEITGSKHPICHNCNNALKK